MTVGKELRRLSNSCKRSTANLPEGRGKRENWTTSRGGPETKQRVCGAESDGETSRGGSSEWPILRNRETIAKRK